jgi:hypothetical protein
MTTCEYCGKQLWQGDAIHGVKYGSLTNTGFKAAQDSAVTVICGPCGNMLYGFIYASLDQSKPTYPALYRTYEELTKCLKNGYRLIQAISKLPVSDQSAIQRLIATYKQAK